MSDSEGNPSLIVSWTTLPPEPFETILTYLDVDSVKALRLTDRRFAEKCVGPRFLSFIQQPILDVSSQNLRSLYALACNPALSKMIHSLTFLATSLDSSEAEKNVKSGNHTVRRNHGAMFETTTTPFTAEEFSNAKSNLKWLKQQQKARATESPSEMIELLEGVLTGFHGLHSIRLDGAALKGPTERATASQGEWHSLWIRASHVFYLVVTALAQSGVSVKTFNAYRQTHRCCVTSNDITKYASDLNPRQLEIVSKGLESFELSTSAEVQTAVNSAKVRGKGAYTQRGYFITQRSSCISSGGHTGNLYLLKSAHALRELDLSFRHALREGCPDSYDKIIESIAKETQFPMLEKCAFSGFLAKGESILLFLQKHPNLRFFTLHECHLTTGSWPPIFAHLSESMPKLESVSFSNLYGKCGMQGEQEGEEGTQEHSAMVNLQPIWDTNPPPYRDSFTKGPGRQVHTRTFNREDLKKGLVFPPLVKLRGRAKGSRELMRWTHTREERYGAP
ncbi:uncharacterized protein N7515_008139 [Penicillium bovifimosum]|uniref:F-box domain-containing protein n=1 Tax=Penicillium bovifimosum TaxID=126998 RepID=A0A9W9KW24_9EURO|nr:uncharacterized protein N7515_008139 [Penicillium bovifimosum]KAJ5124314.1 hypothetical protein N7515_008139 [Penicillium bovifimosum]